MKILFVFLITLTVILTGCDNADKYESPYDYNADKYESPYDSPKNTKPNEYLSKAEKAEQVKLQKECPYNIEWLSDAERKELQKQRPYKNADEEHRAEWMDNSWRREVMDKSEACKKLVLLKIKEEGSEGFVPSKHREWGW